MATVYYKIVDLDQYLSDVETQLNTLGTAGWELSAIFNTSAILISGSSGISVTGSVVLPAGVVSSSGQVSYTGLSNVPAGIVSSSGQVSYTGLSDIPAGILSSSTQINALSNVSAAFASTAPYSGLTGVPSGIVSSSVQINTGSFSGSFVGTLTGTGSWATNAISSSYALSSSYAVSGSHAKNADNAISSSYALSSSYAVTASHVPLAYGQWYSVQTQTTTANTASVMYYDSQSFARGTLFSGSRIYVQQDGVYNLQFSAELNNTTNSNIDIDVWFRKDGTNIPNSNTTYQIDKQAGTFGHLVAALNVMEQLNSGSYIEIVWSSTASSAELLYIAPASNPTRPATPSVITTITQVG